MKIRISKILPLFLLQDVVALISGILVSKMSRIGSIGIRLFLQEYSFFRSWWQTAIIFLGIYMLLNVLLWVLWGKGRMLRVAAMVLVILGAAGLYFTYRDFQETFTHRLMKENFHLGCYLFWVGWIVTPVYFLRLNRSPNKVH